MGANGFDIATPARAKSDMEAAPWIDFSSGNSQRGVLRFPRQGEREPWLFAQDYRAELRSLRDGPIDDDMLLARASESCRASSSRISNKPDYRR